MASSGSARSVGRPKSAGFGGDPASARHRGGRRLAGERVRRGQRPRDRPAGGVQPGARLLPLRFGRQPAARRVGRRQLGSARPVRGGGGRAAGTRRAGRCRPGRVRGGSPGRLHRRPRGDDGRGVVDPRPRPRGGGPHRAVAGLRRRCRPPVGGRHRAGRAGAAEEVAHGIVALYLGLEMLAHLDGDASPALALFDRAGRLAGLLELLGGPAAPEPSTTTPEPSTAPKEER